MKQTAEQAKQILTPAALLMLFAVFGAALVGMTFMQTENDIRHNEEMTLLKKLNSIIPAELYNNDLLLDTITIGPDTLLATQQSTLVYRARKDDRDVAVVFSVVASNGYNGPVDLLIGIKDDGTIAGVRVVKHRETPGLGDKINLAISDWILGFNNRSLDNPGERGWNVKRDGGVFDQFTGATITPRAVVQAVHNALIYFDSNRDMLFARTPENPENSKQP